MENSSLNIKNYINNILEVKNVSQIDNVTIDGTQYSKAELDAYVQKTKAENENFDSKLEIIRLQEIIENYKKENSKLPKAKELLQEYQELIESKDKEIEKLKEENKKYCEYIERIPKFVKKVFLKDKLLVTGDKNNKI